MNPFSSNDEQTQPFHNMLRGGHQGHINRGASIGNGNRGVSRGGHPPSGRYINQKNDGNIPNITPVQDNPNPRYKGKNFDPNYHQKSKSGAQDQTHPLPLPFTQSNNDGIQRGGFRARPVFQDNSGDTHMCDISCEELESKCAKLEERHETLETDIKFFLNVLGQKVGQTQIGPFLQQFTQAKPGSPLTEIIRQLQN